MMQIIEQAKSKMKCIFCGKITFFSDKNKAYCIDCYCKLRDSAHTHDLPSNTPITPMPTITTTVPSSPNHVIAPYRWPGVEGPQIIC